MVVDMVAVSLCCASGGAARANFIDAVAVSVCVRHIPPAVLRGVGLHDLTQAHYLRAEGIHLVAEATEAIGGIG